MFTKAITSDKAPKAIGPYSPGIKLGDFVYLSGQIPADPATGEIVPGGIKQQTHQVFQNILALLEEMGLETRHIVKTTVFITDMSMFADMNEVYATYFDAEHPYPARSCVQVGALPKGALVEIECLVIDTLNYEKPREKSCCSGGDCNGCR